MVEDRNELMTHAWTGLRRFCPERQVELIEVDLRCGIAEEQNTRKETLKLCLDEIRACRPLFIGLLGERYGWVGQRRALSKLYYVIGDDWPVFANTDFQNMPESGIRFRPNATSLSGTRMYSVSH
jgi:Domain of unknown function (DUF4062)